MMKSAVIGSINMDLDISVPRFPVPGETLTGNGFETLPGGKGANQAVALGRLGMPIKMAGRIGNDVFGKSYMENFARSGVDTEAVDTVEGASTGIADILINADAENYIVLVPGANALCDLAWLDSVIGKVADCDVILMQLEIPLDTVTEAAKRLSAMGKTIILDPAPAVPLPKALLENVDYVTPNETELRIITSELDEDADVEARVKHLLGSVRKAVIHKRGGDGAYIGTADGVTHVPGYKVKAVDTTAAGDSFNAGFAAGLMLGKDLFGAVRMGNAVGALAVTAFGAQEGMPRMADVERLMEEQK